MRWSSKPCGLFSMRCRLALRADAIASTSVEELDLDIFLEEALKIAATIICKNKEGTQLVQE